MIKSLAPLRHPRIPRRFKFLRVGALLRSRRVLAELDDAALKDVGLTRTEAEAEARRAVWDAPDHWYR